MPSGGAAAAAPAAAAEAPAEEKPKEKTIFTVKLEKIDATQKAKVIREVKAIMPNMNLVEVSVGIGQVSACAAAPGQAASVWVETAYRRIFWRRDRARAVSDRSIPTSEGIWRRRERNTRTRVSHTPITH